MPKIPGYNIPTYKPHLTKKPYIKPFYIIVILIAGLSSILSKRKKKAAEADNELPELPDLEDIIPEYTVYTQPERPVYQQIKKQEPKQSVPKYNTIGDRNSLKTNQKVRSVSNFVGSEVLESDDMSFNMLELSTPDDVKKAFIYSEIFNRKY